MNKPIYSRLPDELATRCDDGGNSSPTWADIQYHCEGGLDLCVPTEDFYSIFEQRRLRPMFERWLAKAKAAQAADKEKPCR